MSSVSALNMEMLVQSTQTWGTDNDPACNSGWSLRQNIQCAEPHRVSSVRRGNPGHHYRVSVQRRGKGEERSIRRYWLMSQFCPAHPWKQSQWYPPIMFLQEWAFTQGFPIHSFASAKLRDRKNWEILKTIGRLRNWRGDGKSRVARERQRNLRSCCVTPPPLSPLKSLLAWNSNSNNDASLLDFLINDHYTAKKKTTTTVYVVYYSKKKKKTTVISICSLCSNKKI